MFGFVTWLKAIAAVLITNSHYADIWPISALACGGHIGNCLFFFLSGFCLFHIKDSFPKWYIKRILRIYPVLWIVNTVALLAGQTHIGEFMGFVHCYFYPTWFHFIGSIMLLYAVYYVIRYAQQKLHFDIRWLMLAALAVYLLLYVTIFDKSTYHIDDVGEKWVRFMFFEAMMMGVWLREQYDRISDRITGKDISLFAVSMVAYFVGKVALSRFQWLSGWQCFLPIVLLIYIYSIAIIFIKLEKNGFFGGVNRLINSVISFVAGITLEIYLGQGIVLWAITGLPFPINFIVVTAVILLYAWLLHLAAKLIQKPVYRLLDRSMLKG